MRKSFLQNIAKIHPVRNDILDQYILLMDQYDMWSTFTDLESLEKDYFEYQARRTVHSRQEKNEPRTINIAITYR